MLEQSQESPSMFWGPVLGAAAYTLNGEGTKGSSDFGGLPSLLKSADRPPWPGVMCTPVQGH